MPDIQDIFNSLELGSYLLTKLKLLEQSKNVALLPWVLM